MNTVPEYIKICILFFLLASKNCIAAPDVNNNTRSLLLTCEEALGMPTLFANAKDHKKAIIVDAICNNLLSKDNNQKMPDECFKDKNICDFRIHVHGFD